MTTNNKEAAPNGTAPRDVQTTHKFTQNTPEILAETSLVNDITKDVLGSEIEEITAAYLLQTRVEKLPTLLDPIFPQVGNIALAGGSDTGKSCLLRQLTIDLVYGESSFLGFTFNAKHRRAYYVASEDDQLATSFLLGAQANDRDPARLENLVFIFEIMNLLEDLDRRLTAKPADLVIIDCFADAYGGDLKDSQKIRTFLHQYQELAVKHQCLILWLHHTGKRTENLEPSKNNLLSGQGFEAKMRMVMELRLDQSDPTLRHLCIVKGNYLPAKYKKESFVLRFHESHFRFMNTHERTPFELLVKSQDDPSKAKWEQAKDLKAQGYTYEQIADKIGYDSKGSVSKLFKKAAEQGWDKDGFQEVSNGNEQETGRKRA